MGQSVWASDIVLANTPISALEVQDDTLFPESITYNSVNRHFVIGSFRQGAIYDVDEKGGIRKLIDDERLHSVFAVRIDRENNRLLALTSDLGASVRSEDDAVKKLAALGIYDLSSGKVLNFVDLSGLLPNSPHLVNGMALDHEGNAYITDSFASAIYKVDINGTPSIFLKDDTFDGDGINLNGIVYHPDGYLLAVNKRNGVLYRIPQDHPEDFTVVESDSDFLGADGLILVDNDRIIIIANRIPWHNTDTAFAISSSNSWRSANVSDHYQFGDVYPTTGVLVDDSIFVIHCRLNTLVAAPKQEKTSLRQKVIIEQIGTVTHH
tara:strand:+ start:2571 stop:3539 length:969 start_codon:yes stop_codon:yes gene_type:complete